MEHTEKPQHGLLSFRFMTVLTTVLAEQRDNWKLFQWCRPSAITNTTPHPNLMLSSGLFVCRRMGSKPVGAY